MKLTERLKRAVRGRIAERLADAGLGALIVGGFASLIEADIARTEIDAVVTGAAVVVTVFERWRAKRKSKS